ncbi:MAG: hypothetical protein QOJ92_1820 [Frankiales bacterium]|nr:hypothetical protein [Frankiales bacterium]
MPARKGKSPGQGPGRPLVGSRLSDLDRLTELIEAGGVTPGIDRIFSLDRVSEAVRQLEAGQVRGKVAISF